MCQQLGPTSPPGTPAPSSATSSSHTPDYLTPTLLLLIFNITLPSLDLYNDLTMLIWLYSYPQYLAWGIFLFTGVFLNFLFTCLVWWRIEPRQKKPWTWILLLLQVQEEGQDASFRPDSCFLQVWPQARAVRVLLLTWRGDPTARQEKAKLDRDVGGLEPFLEGLPTVFVIASMSYYKEGGLKVMCSFTKPPLFQRNRLPGGGNSTFEINVVGKYK